MEESEFKVGDWVTTVESREYRIWQVKAIQPSASTIPEYKWTALLTTIEQADSWRDSKDMTLVTDIEPYAHLMKASDILKWKIKNKNH